VVKMSALMGKVKTSLSMYSTDKRITIEDWRAGALHKSLIVGVIIFVCYQMFADKTWAFEELPSNAVNSWPSDGNSQLAASMTASDLAGNYTYCDPTYTYALDSYFTYDGPVCISHVSSEVTQKGVSSMFYTTNYIENFEIGWPCGAIDTEATRLAGECSAIGGVTIWRPNGQCHCDQKRTVYVAGVDDFEMVVDHTMSTSETFEKEESKRLAGASGNRDTTRGEVISSVKFKDDSYRHFKGSPLNPSTGSVRMTVRDWLVLAGYTLDDVNTDAGRDYRGGTNYTNFPTRRITGAKVLISIKYNNDPELETDREVTAEFTADLSVKDWAGLGPIAYYKTFPSGGPGQQYYHKVIRYRQGVVFEFKAKGKVYKFDFMTFLTVLIDGVVLLGVAKTVTDIVITTVLGPTSTLVKRKRDEPISIKGAFAEMGVKAVLSAGDFKKIDDDGNGVIVFEDLVKIFKKIPDVTENQARGIAQTILDDDPTAGPVDSATTKRQLSFTDFMTIAEGSVMDFDFYLKHMKRRGNEMKGVSSTGSVKKLGEASLSQTADGETKV